jgi:phage shock protein A
MRPAARHDWCHRRVALGRREADDGISRNTIRSARARRKRLERIRRLRAERDASWSETAPLARQAAALELARDEVPWLLRGIEELTDGNETLSAQLDDCTEMLEACERH